MYRRLFISHILALMFCACLPMTPIMSAGIEAATSGNVAELGNDSSSDLPILSSISPRWDLMQIEAPQAWKIVSGGKNVVVAVLDTGIDAEHKDLKGKILDKAVFTASSGWDVERGHGTHIAGIIAGALDNTVNVGLAYHCSLLDVKVAENDGTTDAKKVAQGILWAADHGANVINISIVINKPYPLLEYAVDYAWQKGCLIVAAAGNSDSDKPVYPAAYSHVIAVAASDKNDDLTRWSNRGNWVTVSAPGVDIYSTLPNNEFGYKSGTSFSSALVSGEAALLYSQTAGQNPDTLLNERVREEIINHYDKSETDDIAVHRINVYKATLSTQTDNPALSRNTDN